MRDCGIHAVMLAPDWFVAPGTETQDFPCDVPPSQLCTGINQWPATLVVTPDLHAYKWELVRMLVKDTPTTCY